MTVSPSPWPAGTPGWADITVADPVPVQRFYGALLGWRFDASQDGAYLIATLDGKAVAGVRIADAPTPAWWCVYLATDDVTESVERAVDGGATVLLPPVVVLDEGRMAVVADPTGAAVGLWESRARTGWEVTDVPGASVWAEQMSHDPDTARRFYVELFGYDAQDMSAPDFRYASLAVGGTPAFGIGGYGPGAGDVPAAWTWYLAVPDADDAARRVGALDGDVVSGPEDTPYGRMLLVRGPAGELAALLEVRDEDGF